MIFIAIDLELEQPKSNHQTPDSRIDKEKIIQLGMVVFETGDEMKVLHSETMFLHYPYELSSFIKSLTSIKDEEVNFATADAKDALKRLGALMREFKADRRVVEWGSGDIRALIRESGLNDDEIHNLGVASRTSFNVKTIFQVFAMANHIKSKSGLSKSMSKLGVSFRNTRYNDKNKGAHWAETDALNTALIFNELLIKMRHIA